MSRKTATFFLSKYNIKEDDLSRLIRKCSVEIHDFGHQYSNARNICDYRISGDFELIFVVGGKSLITIEDTEYELGKGQIIVIPPFTGHKIDTPKEDPHDNYWIHFDVMPIYYQKEFRSLLTQGLQIQDNEWFEEEIHPLLRQMELEKELQSPGYKLYFDNLFQQVLLQIFRQGLMENPNVTKEKTAASGEWDIVERGMQFIQDHVEEDICVKDICEYLHISESYLHKTFSKVLSLSPNHLILLCKVKRGELHLRTTNSSIKEIALKLSFSSQYYFSSVFKKFYGMSPREFLKRK